ncbi:MAG: DUF2076 domain-containing protein [Acidobacteriota bacterium]|nr:DUF2076 domain-containing protein [Acidobacteriota bacterium]
MTPDEQKMLNDLADKVAQMPAPPRDPDAEDLIRTKIGRRPDALYLMTQTVLIQNLALQRAQQQLQDLQQRSPQGQVGGGSSWLGRGPVSSQPAPTYTGGGQSQYSAPPPPQSAAPAGGGGSSFLRGAAQTAAGVAAGSLAAEAIGSMFSHGGGMFGGGGSGFLGGGAAPGEEVVNNYYDSSGGSGDNFGGDNQANSFVDPGDVNASDDSSQFDDTSLDTGGGFDGGSDDNFV